MAGPVILDLLGPEMSAEEREILQHPLVGGVILFTRNYQSPEQVTELCQTIRKARKTPLLIAVDQEGGRVQRMRTGFTDLPPLEMIGKRYDESPEAGIRLAEVCGWLMASEVLSVGIDFSFAPVLDLNKKVSSVIGDRSFHRDPLVVAKLATAYVRGMSRAGMAATGKHFPGHGSVVVDSHLDLPVDTRSLDEITNDDMVAFKEMILAGIQAFMPAHILFPAVDDKPVGFSSVWLQDILRKQLKFNGVIFSDCLSMEGAKVIGDHDERARVALEAGCDIVLICNHREAALKILDRLPADKYAVLPERFKVMQGQFSLPYGKLHNQTEWKENLAYLQQNAEQTLT